MGFFKDLIFNGLNDITNVGSDFASDPTGSVELETKACSRCSNCCIKNVQLDNEPYGVAHVLFCEGYGSEKHGVLKEYGTSNILTSLDPLDVSTSCTMFAPACDVGEESPLRYEWQNLGCDYEWEDRPFDSLSDGDKEKILHLEY